MEPEICPFEKDKETSEPNLHDFGFKTFIFVGRIFFSTFPKAAPPKNGRFQMEKFYRSGAETGAGGRIRDGESTGKGSLVRGTWLHEFSWLD